MKMTRKQIKDTIESIKNINRLFKGIYEYAEKYPSYYDFLEKLGFENDMELYSYLAY